MKSRLTLSIIVVAHREGRIVERTIKSLLGAVKGVEAIGVKYDFLVNVDNGDSETVTSFEKALEGENYKIYHTDFGDPGLARNSIVRKSKSDYVALIDADDMVSSNWLRGAIERILSEGEMVLVHPEVEIRFNNKSILAVNVRVDSDREEWLNNLTLFGDNRWCSISLGRREIFLDFEYSASGNGFGYEDYYFNCIVAEAGIRHLVAHGTTAFLLQKESSVTTRTHANYDVLPRVELFDPRRLQKKAKKYGLPEPFEGSRFVEMPGFVAGQAHEIAKIDARVEKFLKHGSDFSVSKDGTYEDFLIGVTFCEMIRNVKLWRKVKTIAFVDNLVDFQTIKDKYGEKMLFVVVGEAENIWGDSNVINFNKYFGWMYPIAKNLALTRLIVQLCPGELLVSSNDLVRDWVKAHGGFLRENGIEVSEVWS